MRTHLSVALWLSVTLSLSVVRLSAEEGTAAPRPPAAAPPAGQAEPPAGTPAAGRPERPLPPPPAEEQQPRPEEEPGRVQRQGDQIMVDMSFEKADLVTVLRMLGRLAKTTIAIDTELTGQVTIAATGRITLEEAFELMNSVLEVKGYTMVGRFGDGVIKVLPEKKAATSGVAVATGNTPESVPEKSTYLTQVIPVEYIDAQRLAQELKPLVASDAGSLVASSSTNHLIVTDTASNVKRIVAIVSELDKDSAQVLTVEVIPLDYADAQATADLLNNLFQQPLSIRGMRIDPRTGRPVPTSSRGRPPRGATPTSPGLMQTKEQIKVQADERTNSVVVSASKERLAQVREIIKQLDVNLEPEVKVQVFKLKNADATQMADEINQMLEQPEGGYSSSRFRFPWSRSRSRYPQQTRVRGVAGFKENLVIPDVRNNTLIVTGTEENLQAIGELIQQLDVESPLTEIVRVYHIENADAETVANTLQQSFYSRNRFRGFFSFLFGNRGQTGAVLDILQDINVQADKTTNSLVVTAPPQAHSIVEQMIKELDKPLLQVYIEVAIVDVTLDENTKLGVEWSWKQGPNTLATDFGVAANQTEGMRYTVVAKDLSAVLNALAETTEMRVLSTPHVTTTDNVKATVKVGTQYPYVKSISQTASGQIPQFDWYDITVQLDVTPRIKTAIVEPETADGKPEETRTIQMVVQQTINELQGTVNQLGFTMPIVGTRTADTQVTVADGETIVLGGMMRESVSKVHTKVPILGDLPLLGGLFRSTNDRTTNNELLVFLTPHVLKNNADVRTLTETARGRTKYLNEQGFLKSTGQNVKTQAPRPGSSPPAKPKAPTAAAGT